MSAHKALLRGLIRYHVGSLARQRESASMTLNPSVGQLSLLFASSRHIFGGSFLAEHFSVPIKQRNGARSSSEDCIFVSAKAGDCQRQSDFRLIPAV